MKIDTATDFAGNLINPSLFDPLTELPNRQKLQSVLKDYYPPSDSCDQTALLTVALDNFSNVNDSYGYDAGDQVLFQVARRLEQCCSSAAIIARLASDEFCVVTSIENGNSINTFCEKLLSTLRKPFAVDNIIVQLSASVGVAYMDDSNRNRDDLITHSLQACRLKKADGKNGFAVYSKQLLQQHNQKLYLKHALVEALNLEQLEVFYQPIINLKTQQLEKCEALLRWRHNGKNIPPAQFIPIAEEYGLAKQLGDYVWKKTCRQLVDFSRHGLEHIRVSINRSMAEFPQADYSCQQWLAQLDKNNLSQNQISFEITETLLAPDNPGFTDYLKRLKQGGCTISLDDFGTGYSSLSYLREFPIDYLKIDRSFIKELGESRAAYQLVSSIIDMARSLNIKTIAEGVETIAQLEKLQALECDFIQGYLFSKAIAGEAFIEFSNSFSYEKSLAS